MPQPFTVVDPVTGNPLFTVDQTGNLYAAGAARPLGAISGGNVGPPLWPSPNLDLLATGESVLARPVAGGSVTLTGGTVLLSYFTAGKTATATAVSTFAAGTAAAGLTTAQAGVYVSDLSGNLTLQAATVANVAGLWQSTFTAYTTALTAPFQRVAGQRYALAVLAAGTTPPALQGAGGPFYALTPPLAMTLAGQAALPASILATALGAPPNAMAQGILTP